MSAVAPERLGRVARVPQPRERVPGVVELDLDGDPLGGGERRALERLLVDGDRAPQRCRSRSSDRVSLLLQVLRRDLLREQRAEPAELRDRRLRLLHRDAQLQDGIAVAVAGVLVADGLRVAAERADDLRRLVRLAVERPWLFTPTWSEASACTSRFFGMESEPLDPRTAVPPSTAEPLATAVFWSRL